MSQAPLSMEDQMRERARRMREGDGRESSEPMDIDDPSSGGAGRAPEEEHRAFALQRSLSQRNQKVRRLEDMRSQLEAQQAELQRKLESVAAAIREEQDAFAAERKELDDLLSAPQSMDTDDQPDEADSQTQPQVQHSSTSAPSDPSAPSVSTSLRTRPSNSSTFSALSPRRGPPTPHAAAVSAAEQARLDEELARSLQAQYDREMERERNEAQRMMMGGGRVGQQRGAPSQQPAQPQPQPSDPSSSAGPTDQPFPQFTMRTEDDGRGGHRRVISFMHRSGGGPGGSGLLGNPFFGAMSGFGGMDSDEDDPFGRSNVSDPFNLLGMRGLGFGGTRRNFLPIHFGGMGMMGPAGGGMLNIDQMDHDTLLRLFPPRPRGARRDDIEQLPTDTFRAPQPKPEQGDAQGADDEEKGKEDKKPLDDENRKCCICLEQFEDGDTIRRLPCLHIFHRDEIDEWLRRNHICPICRSPIEQSELPPDAQ